VINLKQKIYTTPTAVIRFWTNDLGKKPTVFFMHGAAMDHRMFDDQINAMAGDYNIITWDARGHGESRPVNGAFTINDLAKDACGILNSLAIPSAIFVGQSEGGMIAQEVYKIDPAKVLAIATIGASPIMLPYSKMDIRLLRLSTTMIKVCPYHSFMKALAKKTAIKAPTQTYALETVQKISKRDFLSIWSGVTGSISVNGIKDMHIKVPLLITYGQYDMTGTVKKNNVRWKTYEPLATLVEIPDAGHNANQDNPTYLNKLLLEFLQTVTK
jgi:pimeloyl-ACP methyl ester carboxylesterase